MEKKLRTGTDRGSYALSQWMKIMKLTCFLLLISFLQVAATSYSQGNSLNLKITDASLKTVLLEIEKQSGYSFLYNDANVNVNQRVSLNVKDHSLMQVLDYLFEDSEIAFKIVEEHVILINNQTTPERVTQSQKVRVSGVVIDKQGEPLPGVNVYEKENPQNGVITGIDGSYSIAVDNPDDVLVYSFIGFEDQELTVAGRSSIDVTLVEEVTGIDEVVVVGYGTQKKVNLTGAVSSISSKELEARPITNMTNALSGLATGVHVSQSDGQPGRDDATIRIRGIGTLNNANPLVLVDGIESSMSDVNPNDVENISVLKDAASAAIYGSRAANGVILITTKKGQKGELKVSYDGYFAMQSTTKKMDYVSDFATYMEMGNEAYANVGMAPLFSQTDIDAWRSDPDPVYRPNVDWVNEWYGNSAPMHSHHLSIAGGGERTTYNFSLGYLDQDGITPDTWAKRYNFRMNWEANILDNLKFGTNLSGSWKKLEDPDFAEIFHQMPGIPYEQHPDGRYGYAQALGAGTVNNPRAYWEHRDALERQTRFLGKVYLNWEFLNGFTFSHNSAINFNNILNNYFMGNVELWNFNEDVVLRTLGNPETASNRNREYYMLTHFTTLNYQKTVAENHNLNALAGFSLEQYRYDEFGASIQEFHNNKLKVLDAGLENPQVNGTAREAALMSWFGRINYDYKGKYLLEANLRYDGSSRFMEGNRWDAYPSFSAGWRISEEGFMQNVAWLDNLKLRASYGKLGNQNIINKSGGQDYYPYQTTYTLGQNYTMGGAITSGIASTSVVDPMIVWESTTTSNVAVDATLFRKLNVTAEYFMRTTEDILIGMNIPKTMGDKSPPTVNLAEVENKGWELSASYQDRLGELQYQVGFNVTNVSNVVTKYQGEVRSSGNFVIWEGHPFRSMYGYVCDGIIRTQDELDDLNLKARELSGNENAYYISNKTAPGDLKYADLDGNGIIDSNDQDIIGNTIPKYTYGMNLGLSYKGFDFNALLQGAYGHDSYLRGVGVYPMGVNGDRGQIPLDWVSNRYVPEDESTWQTASLPRLVNIGSHTHNYKFSTFWKQDASYLRVKTLQLGYTFPNTKSIGVDRIRLFLNGENLFTFTKFEGYDPERSQTATGITRYPLQKTISVGAQISF